MYLHISILEVYYWVVGIYNNHYTFKEMSTNREKKRNPKVMNFVNNIFRLKFNFKDRYTWTIKNVLARHLDSSLISAKADVR